MSQSIRTEYIIINRLGLHARAAAKLASTAGKFGCVIKTGRDPENSSMPKALCP
jgi:phosphotransferase system HPr (HPr) family protein